MILIWGVTNKQEETQGMASHFVLSSMIFFPADYF
jgi:hypothetical protein